MEKASSSPARGEEEESEPRKKSQRSSRGGRKKNRRQGLDGRRGRKISERETRVTARYSPLKKKTDPHATTTEDVITIRPDVTSRTFDGGEKTGLSHREVKSETSGGSRE